MAEKLLRGHHVKNLAIAVCLGRFDPWKNRRSFSYIIDGNPDDMVRIIAGDEDGGCEDCRKFEYETYAKCRASHSTQTAIRRDEEYDRNCAQIWDTKVGETYRAADLVKKLSSVKRLIRGTYVFLNLYDKL